MPGRMEFGFNMGGNGSSPRKEEAPFSLLLLGHYGETGAYDVAESPVVQVDIDNLDSLWERFQPRVELDIDGLDMVFEPRDLDDFHPDQLLATLPAFGELRQLRRQLLDPATSGESLARVLGASRSPAPEPAEPGKASAPAESGEDMMSRLLGGARPESGDAPKPRPPAGLDALIRSAVAPHIVPDSDPRADAAVDSVERGLAELLRKVLHDEGFQALETRWRSLYRLVQNIETDETLELRVCNVSRDALVAALPTSLGDLEDSGLYGLLVARHRLAADDRTPSLVAVDQAFGGGPDDMALLGTLGALAGAMGACVIGGARPELVGASDTGALGDHRAWRGTAEPGSLWETLREAPFATHIGLVLPGVLSRLPYGSDTDPVRAFDFEEMPSHDPDGFAWAGPVPGVCELLLECFTRDGWDMDPVGALDLGELPAFSYRADGEVHMQPCTECLMPETSLQAALDRGIMPLGAFRSQDRARLVRVQSIASPASALHGPWSD